MKWKNILLAGLLLAGMSLCSIVDAQSTLRNKPAGHTREQALYEALKDGLNTDGSWTDLGSVTTVDINGGTVDGASVGTSSANTGTFTAIFTSGFTDDVNLLDFGTDTTTRADFTQLGYFTITGIDSGTATTGYIPVFTLKQ